MPVSHARPNFFIVGAPRCGTTALSSYLDGHPDICFSRPKETQYFCTDMPGIRLMDDEGSYLSRCFGHCDPAGRAAIGEGSVWHLFSREAIGNILRFDPDARFIIMVRNPIELCLSLHARWHELLWEDEPSFEVAWALQERRARGERIPRHCKDHRVLLYRQVARLGEQVERACALIPPRQRLVIVFDDFRGHTDSVYRRVLDFLGLPDDHRSDFSRINQSRRLKSWRLWELACSPPEKLVSAVERGKRILGIERLGVLKRVRGWLLTEAGSPAVPATLKLEMLRDFSDDIDLLSSLLERDLSHWKRP